MSFFDSVIFPLDLFSLITTIRRNHLFRQPVIMNHQVITAVHSTKSLKTPTNFKTPFSSERIVFPAHYFEELEVTRKNVRA